MIQMNVITFTLIASIVLGAIGTFSRVGLQTNRDKQFPVGDGERNMSLVIEHILGLVAGGLSWLIYSQVEGIPETHIVPVLYLGAWALGYVFPDAAEALATAYKPGG